MHNFNPYKQLTPIYVYRWKDGQINREVDGYIDRWIDIDRSRYRQKYRYRNLKYVYLHIQVYINICIYKKIYIYIFIHILTYIYNVHVATQTLVAIGTHLARQRRYTYKFAAKMVSLVPKVREDTRARVLPAPAGLVIFQQDFFAVLGSLVYISLELKTAKIWGMWMCGAYTQVFRM